MFFVIHNSEYIITKAMGWVIEQNTISVYVFKLNSSGRPRHTHLLLSAVEENIFGSVISYFTTTRSND